MTADPAQPALEIRGLAFGYGAQVVGSDANLCVHSGDVLCLLGPNGSGKTTLFKTMLGLLPPLAGQVFVGGETLAGLQRRTVARRVSYVPQAHGAHFPYRVIDMVVMGRTAHLGLFAAPSATDREHAYAALHSLGIADLAMRPYTRISGGQRQLALIARALAQNAPAIVMDEPTASLDFGNQVRVLSEIRRLSARGLAIVLSTHDPDHAAAIATNVALLHEGKLLAMGRPDDVITPENLERVYGVKVRVEALSNGSKICVPQLGA